MIICFKMCNFRAGYLNFYMVFAFTTALNARKSVNAFFTGVSVGAQASMNLCKRCYSKLSFLLRELTAVAAV
jgi:hypothetical protein